MLSQGKDQRRRRADRGEIDLRFDLEIGPQPDPLTCGPTSLHAVYRHWGEEIPLERVIAEVPKLEEGGTLAVLLGCHALARGYRARIYTYNLDLFDPTWFAGGREELARRLEAQLRAKGRSRLEIATPAYLEFLRRGGDLAYEDLTPDLLRRYLRRGVPILTGLSATHLYRTRREFGPDCIADDVRGEPVGHFVVLCGYLGRDREVLVADPLWPNPFAPGHLYTVGIDRLVNSILLGTLTYDGNLLVLEPR